MKNVIAGICAFTHDCVMPKKLQKRDYFKDAMLPLQMHIRDPQPEFPLHTYGFDELVIIFRGTAIHEVNGQ